MIYDELDNTLWNDKCDYVEIEGTANLNPNNYNLSVLQLNIRSLLAHQQELKYLLTQLLEHNCRIDVVLLCETFLAKNTFNMVNIPGYTHICKYRSERKGSRVSILLKNGIPYKRREDLDTFIEGKTESVFIETISKCGKPIIIGSIYQPPNTDLDQFSDNLTNIVNKAQTTKRKISCEIILGMNHNVDLLKGNQHLPTHNFIENLTNLSLYPTITRPSRITHHSATLIDNIYVSDQLHHSFDSMLLINDIFDHLPTLALLKQTKLLKQEPFIYESRCLNDAKLKEVNHRLMRKDWIGLLDGTSCDEKFDQFNNTLNEVLDEIAPMKKVRISAKRRHIEPWMTKGLERAGKTKLKLYRKRLASTSTGADCKEYTEYRNTFNNLKRNLKVQYYQQKCKNVKKLWALINETIRKVKHKGSIILSSNMFMLVIG